MESTLGKRIAINRKRLGLTQDQLAEKLGITAQAVSKWENDLSCPDISILPKLADIFEISIDELLGRTTPISAKEVTVIPDDAKQESGFSYDSESGNMNFHWEGIKLEGIGLACWVLLTGIIYLVTQLVPIEVSFWNILWPSFLLVFGIFGLFPKFSVFRLGCALIGGYFLIDKLGVISITFNSGIIIGVVILLFGTALLLDSLKKNKQRYKYINQFSHAHAGKLQNDYTVDGDQFTYDASFGSATQIVALQKLRYGEISVNFGEFTVDLSQVDALDEHCRLNADCSFGELILLVPKHYAVVSDSSTSFASFTIVGQPNATVQGTIRLHTDVSFGEIRVQYS